MCYLSTYQAIKQLPRTKMKKALSGTYLQFFPSIIGIPIGTISTNNVQKVGEVPSTWFFNTKVKLAKLRRLTHGYVYSK